MNNNERIGRKKIVGLKVIAILSIILYALVLPSGIFTSFYGAYYYGAGSGLAIFLIYLTFFGGFIVLSIIGLFGFNARKSYAIPVNRAVLILFSFWTGIIPIGLILLLIFWPRLKDIDVKIYLNYPGCTSGDIFTQHYKEQINKPLETQLYNDSFQYCFFCGEKLPEEAIFCKKCGRKQNQ